MENTLKIKDLYLAAFLYSQKLELVKVEREQGVCWFVFKERAAAERLTHIYWTGGAVSNIRHFVDCLRTLKDLIFAQR